jgi:hypothetical protein
MELENAPQNDSECPTSYWLGMLLGKEESGGICGIATRECVRGGMRQINFEVVPTGMKRKGGKTKYQRSTLFIRNHHC